LPNSFPILGSVESEPVIRIPWRTLLARAFRRQCPVCGSRDIWTNWIGIKDECPNCHYNFNREPGYFLGATLLNVIFSELLVMALMIIMLIFTDLVWWKVELVILPLAVILPIFYNPFFKGIWLTLDLSAHPVQSREVQLPAVR
jgi:uncharacterized protein (DUF983 family)